MINCYCLSLNFFFGTFWGFEFRCEVRALQDVAVLDFQVPPSSPYSHHERPSFRHSLRVW